MCQFKKWNNWKSFFSLFSFLTAVKMQKNLARIFTLAEGPKVLFASVQLLFTYFRAGKMMEPYSSGLHSRTRNRTGSRTAARTSWLRISCSSTGQECWNHNFWKTRKWFCNRCRERIANIYLRKQLFRQFSSEVSTPINWDY